MKKITFFLVLLFLGFLGNAQGIIENFDDASVTAPTGLGTWTLPSGQWRILDNNVGNVNWGLTTPATPQFPANSNPNAAFINRQNIGAGNVSQDYLVTPSVEIPNNPQLRFYTRTTVAGNQNTVYQVRAALGSSDPNNLASYTYELASWPDDVIVTNFDQYQEKIIDLPAFPEANMYFALVKIYTQVGTQLNGDRWLVDDFKIIEKCQDADPETLVSNASTASSITLQWDGTGNGQWEVQVVPQGAPFDPNAGTPIIVNGTPTTVVTATTQPAGVALTPLTCYDFYVRSICQFSTGEWIGPSEGNVCTQALPPECGGNYVDSGGIDNPYSNNEASTITICPENTGDIVTVTFTSFNTESFWDGIYVYDGNGIDDPLIPSDNGPGNNNDLDTPGAYWGSAIPGPFESSSADGCLTFQFFSDSFGSFDGWTANVTCAPAPTCPKPTAVTGLSATDESVTLSWTPVGPATTFEVIAVPAGSPAPGPGDSGTQVTTTTYTYPGLASSTCFDFYVRAICGPNDVSNWSLKTSMCTQVTPPECGGTFVDTGGPNANYPNNDSSVVTICPENAGEIVTVTFTSFATEAFWDGLYIYDGNSTNAPLIPSNNGSGNNGDLSTPGAYWGSTNPGTFESSSPDGCLTFQFFSDTVFNFAGWTASVTCGPAPTCPKPAAVTLGTSTDTTIPVSWTAVGPATEWHVYAVPCGGTPPTYTTPGYQTATSPTGFSLTGLTPSTCYDVYVISWCGDSETGNPAGPKTINTQVAPPVCGGQYVDEGGPDNYPNSANSVVTICPEVAGEQVTVTFTSFNTETNWDGIYVFDGDSVNAPMIPSENPSANGPMTVPGAYWGTEIPGPFTSSAANGCLTFWFLSDTSVNNPGWVADVTCDPPPTCPKPTALTIEDTSSTTVTVGWTEVGSATQWQVLVLPATDPLPNANTPGWETTSTNPYEYSLTNPLTPGTQYKVYVRAFCSEDDISLWSLPKAFSTTPENDECSTAQIVPVNPGVECVQTGSGTLIGATGSTQENSCTGSADDDVWFQFTALTNTHAITLSNLTGNSFSLNMSVYSGTCDGGLTLIDCAEFTDQMTVSPLEPNAVYYVRVWSPTDTPNQNSTFDICINTVPPPIFASTTQYTVEELVTDVLINSDCASVSNITYSTGTNFGSVNGIGYFNKNGSTFPYEEGIILSSGNADSTPGPNTSTLGEGSFDWPGDADLEAIILNATGQAMNSQNASIIEFDFVPIIPNLSFNFLFASEEYGTFQCSFSDAFAFLLTDTTANTPTQNLAVLPNSTTPISVVTIRDAAYNSGCASVNPEYFDEYYLLPEGSDPIGAPINFNGTTVGLTAGTTVIPGHTYHIKLVVADRSDTAFDSAVFIEGGSFNIGDIELGQNFLQADGTALCDGSSFTLDTELDPTLYTFQWTQDGDVIEGATGATLTITESGVYGATATYNNSTCNATDEVTIEFYPPVQPGTPENLTACNSLGYAEFTLSQADGPILNGLNPAVYGVTYYATEADAASQVNPLPNIYTNVVQWDQQIYANLHTPSGCNAVTSLHLIVNDFAPVFTVTPDFTICEGSSGVISVTPGNFNLADATYSWTLEGNPLPDTTSSITVTLGGTYVVTVNNQGCTGTGTTVVTVTPATVAPTLPDVVSCGPYTLPALTDPNLSYNTAAGCNGTVMNAGDTIQSTQTVYVCATTGSCINSSEFEVTIYTAPTVSTPVNVEECNSYTLPALTAGAYYNQAGGVDPITDLTLGTGLHTVYIYVAPETGSPCLPAETSFTVNVTDAPVADDLQDVTLCSGDCYTLPALSPGNAYWTESGGTGTMLNAGDQICQTTDIFVYASAAANTQCATETFFTVTVTAAPEFTIAGGCQGNAYVLEATAVNYDPATASYSWSASAGDGQVVSGGSTASATVSGAGTYTLTVTVAGCDGQAPYVASSTSCTIQKGISANGDGANDFFDLEGFNVRRLEIYNRYGMKVYERANYTNEWKGQSDKGDELPDGTYYYVIERNDGEPTKTGWIYINRKN